MICRWHGVSVEHDKYPNMANTFRQSAQVAVIGAGNVGIAVAYYLATEQGIDNIVLLDPLPPMSLTSAQSGENYRDWWPHAIMTEFTSHSISLMEQIEKAHPGALAMKRGGYALATRNRQPAELIENLHRTYANGAGEIRTHDASLGQYRFDRTCAWQEAPDGVDVILGADLVHQAFPEFAPDIESVIHIRRAGSISAHDLGRVMLDALRARGVHVHPGRVVGISHAGQYHLDMLDAEGRSQTLVADAIVNAAGPHANDVARMLGQNLPIYNVYQQKIAFDDVLQAIPRDMPFAIDIDGQTLAWADEERALINDDPEMRHLLDAMPGNIHCRPDGPRSGQRIKLGWAYNKARSDIRQGEPLDSQFPEIVLRGASRLHPGLKAYLGHLPAAISHYGGYYTMNDENLPLIGPLDGHAAFMAVALSGYGTMGACAAGSLCAAWVARKAPSALASSLTLGRYDDPALMAEIQAHGQGEL